MTYKPLNLSKITMGSALGLGLLLGSIPIAKAESFIDQSDQGSSVMIYKECSQKALVMAYRIGTDVFKKLEDEIEALGCKSDGLYRLGQKGRTLKVKAGDVILARAEKYGAPEEGAILCKVLKNKTVTLVSTGKPGERLGLMCQYR